MKSSFFIAIVLFLSAMAVSAQTSTGRIIGSVSTADGAVPGATVVVTDNQTLKERTVIANESGQFEVSQLEFGTYTVRISAGGFKTFVASDVKIDAGREYPLNANLEVGQISEEVTVTAGAQEINASNAELSTTISTEQIRELPLNGRNPLALVSNLAGASPTHNSINGQRSSSTTVTRDGLNVQDNYIRTGRFVSDQPTVDDISEITVVTQNAGVETGGGSSFIQTFTPRGGKNYHGSLYIFNRNSEFAANTLFNNANNIPKPFLNRNEFGGSLSGPLPVPNFGDGGGPMFKKNKSFFFFNYEGFRLAQQVAASATTLLPAARTGQFTYVDAGGVQRTVNVLTGQGFNLSTAANQTVFANAGGILNVDPLIQARLLNNLPESGNGVTTGINYLQTVNFQRSDPLERNSFSFRFDYDISDRQTFNAVYRRNNQSDARQGASFPAGFSTQSYVFQGGPTNFFAASHRWTPTGNFSNEIRGGFQYSEPFFFGSNLPDFQIAGAVFTNPEGTFEDQGRNTLYRNIQDNAVYQWGDHSFRFGGQAEWYKFESITNFGTRPTFNISTTGNLRTPGLTAALLPGINATDLARINALRYTLAGIIGTASQTSNIITPEAGYGFQPARDVFNFELYSGYFSDQWRVRPDLTLNLGLRYEFYTPLNSPNPIYLEPQIADPDNIEASLFNPNAVLNYVGGNAGKPGDFFRPDWDNWAPSVSVAYSPTFDKGLFGALLGNSTVIRAGFRVNYVNDEYVKAASTLTAGNSGLGSITVPGRGSDGLTNLRSTFTPAVNPQFEGLPTFPLPTFSAPPRLLSVNNAAAGFLGSTFVVDPNFQVQRLYEWNVGIQRNIGWNMVAEIRYVGNMSNDAVTTTDLNQIDIRNNGFLDDFRKAQSNCRLQGALIAPTAANPLFACTDARYNPAIPGSQPLPVFNQLVGGGVLNNTATIIPLIQQGRVGSLAQTYVQNQLQGGVVLQPTTNSFIIELLTNAGKYQYNALQAEIRRRFHNGLDFRVNYTFSKVLTNILADNNADQNRQGRFVDNNNPDLNWGRADYDRTHVLNATMFWELPFGRGKAFFDRGGWVNHLLGGWQFGSVVNLSSGPPMSIIDPRSTASITFNAGRLSAKSSLTGDEIKALTGVFKTPNGIFFFDPKILWATATAPGQPTLQGFDLNQPLPPGYTLQSVRAANPINQAPFPGQVFFFNEAGETGNLPLGFLNGLPYLNWNASLAKNFRFSETKRLQLRMDAFNVVNTQVFTYSADTDINSTFFGRICSTSASCSYNTPRILQFGARFDF